MKLLITIISLAVLSGCSATGPKYSEHSANIPSLKAESARVVFFRNSRFMSGGVDAQIHINEQKVGECANNAYFYTDVRSGLAQIKADNSGTPGIHLIEKALDSGNEYYYEVLVNEAYVHAGLLGVIGQAAYVANNDNVSGWILKEVTKEQAELQLQGKVFSLDGE